MQHDIRWDLIDRLIDLAIEEDVGAGDATTEATIPENATLSALFTARDSGVVAGLCVVGRMYAKLDSRIEFTPGLQDGEHCSRGTIIACVEGPARSVLTGERLALNILQRMSGVATLTCRYADEVVGTKAKIYDTRKTMPGLRHLDKMAVKMGGGENHRIGLFDMVLIKDNHLAIAARGGAKESVADAVCRAKQKGLPVMVEVDTLAQLEEALPAEPDMVLLDNMDNDTLREAVRMADEAVQKQKIRRPQLEASGGVNIKTVGGIAKTGVDRISVGALTHSAVALDIGLDYKE